MKGSDKKAVHTKQHNESSHLNYLAEIKLDYLTQFGGDKVIH